MDLEGLFVIAVRALLALFVSVLLSAIFYMFGWIVAYSFLDLTSITVTVSAVISVSLGAATGSYAVWSARVRAFYWHIAYGAAVLLCTGGGAAAGLWYGKGQYRSNGLLGIPELSGMITGAILASIIAAMALYYIPPLLTARRRPSAAVR